MEVKMEENEECNEYMEKMQKYMNDFWGISNNDNNEKNNDLESSVTEKMKDSSNRCKLILDKNKLCNKKHKSVKSLFHSEEPIESNEIYTTKEKKSKKKMRKHTVVNENEVEEEKKRKGMSEIHLNLEKPSEIIKGGKQVKIKMNVSKKKEEKKAKENKTKLTEKEKQEAWKSLQEERKEFNKTIDEIRNIAKQHLNKIQKKINLNLETRKVGGKFEKSRKMPYPELMCRKRALKKVIAKKKEMERHSGVKIQNGYYIDMQDIFRKKKKEQKKKRERRFRLF